MVAYEVVSVRKGVCLVSPAGCGTGVVTLREGVSKSKEASHSYVEVHVVGETKYGFTVSTD